MSNKKWLIAELAKWEAEGLVSPSVACAIQQRYSPREDSGERRNWGIIVSCSIGALLVGLGIIALLAANWEFLTRPLRAAVAVFPVLACALAAYWSAAKKLRSRFFWETEGTLWMMAVIAALLIVATTYNVSGDVADLVMAMCVLTLPVVLLTRAALPTIGWMVLPLIWFCMKSGEYSPPFLSAPHHNAAIAKAFTVFIGLQAVGGIAVLRTVLAGEFAPLTALVHAGLSIILPISAFSSIVTFIMNAKVGCLGEAMGNLALILSGVALYHLGAMIRWQGLKFAALLMFGWMFLMIPINDAQRAIWRMFDCPYDMTGFAVSLIPVAFHGVASIVLAALRGKERNWTAISLPILYLAIGFAFTKETCPIVVYVLALAWSAWLFLRGIKDNALDKMNYGAVGLLYLIMAKFLASDASFTIKGIILIASGVALTAANMFIIRRRSGMAKLPPVRSGRDELPLVRPKEGGAK